MHSNSGLILPAVFLLVATKVSSYDEELNIKVNYVKLPVSPGAPHVATPLPPPPVKPPTPSPPVVTVPSPPVPVKVPTPPAPVKPPIAPAPPVAPIVRSKEDCIPLCNHRCKLHSRKGLCMRACLTCCDRCKCVPPGTYGNREVCGKCYTDMITHGNRSKCP